MGTKTTAWASIATLVAAALLVGPLPAASQAAGTAVVHLADGSQLALRNWSFSYELSTRPKGRSLAQAVTSRRPGTELWLGKKSYSLAGSQLEIEYGTAQREREVDGAWRKVPVAVADGLSLTGPDGKRETLKLEPPHKDLLMPEADKDLLVYPRSLDLLGESLTGTRRSFCLLSFTSLVECSDDPTFQVVRVEFQP